MLRHCSLGLVLAGTSIGCAAAAPGGDLAPLQPGLDYHSFANTEQFRLTRLELDMRVDSRQKVLSAVVGLHFKRLDPAATELILDTRDLDVRDVSQKPQDVLGATAKTETTWVDRPYHFERKDPILGQALVIELPPSNRSTEFIRIEYDTSPAAPALQWLSAVQTRGKPFLYTVSEPIAARSWIPLQDTPQVRFTFKALIHTSPDVLAVMSARNDPGVKHNGEYSFVMQDAIPSYLMALAVGDLAFQETGPRTGVYAQKSLLKGAAREFGDAEGMLRIGEKILGAYRFGRFDIVVMPRNFPAASMGSPPLTFVSPTVIAGDKSLVAAIAHEAAHSWAGGLVDNSTWRDLWLNEGFADYLGGRLMSSLYGAPREAMAEVRDVSSLRADLVGLKPADQALAADLRGRDPQEAFTEVPYVKGRLLLEYLDSKFGRERFDGFLRGYYDQFAFQSITTEQFVKYLRENLLDRFPGIVSPDEVTAWIGAPGLPPHAVLPATDAFAAVDPVRVSWVAGTLSAKKLPLHEWVPEQWVYFLGTLPASLPAGRMAELDGAFGRSANAEIDAGWLLAVIRNRYQPAYVRLEEYLQNTGRRELIAPLYTELMKTPAGAAQANRVFKLARPGYPPQTDAAVAAIVHPSSDDDEAADE